MKTIASYTVAKGDTLFGIAKKFGMAVADLRALNGLKADVLKIGQVLKIHEEQTAPPPPTPGNTSFTNYTVVKGDTLSAIGRRFGVSAEAIMQANKLGSTALKIGQVLRIPKGSSPTTPPVVTPPVVTPPVVTPPVVTPPAGGDFRAARQQFGLSVRPDVGCQRYDLTVPLLDGRTVLCRMRDNVSYSPFMKYPEGIVYGGQSMLSLPVERVESVGLNRSQAAALEYVSSHEGKYDAINSYDSGIFSYGSIQFVGAAEHGSSLNRLMANMKANAPVRFSQVFRRVGIDSEGGVTTVLDENGRVYSGDAAWLYIQKTVPLYGAFVQAGFDPDLVLEQLRTANDLYVQPALNFKLNLTINGIKITIPRLRDILSSEAMLTALIAIAVNRGTGSMSRIVADALTVVAAPAQPKSADALRWVDERLLCQTIADTTTDTRTRERAQGVLNSGLSFAKV